MSTELYQNNIEILSKLYPELAEAIEQHDINHLNFEVVEHQVATLSINGIQLSSAYDPVEEALAYRSTTSGGIYHMWGFGIGSVAEVLLNDRSLKKIHIYIYNLDVIKLVLTLMPKLWLADTRVELHFVHKNMNNQVSMLNRLFIPNTFIINADLYLAKHCNLNLNWLIHRIENRLMTIAVSRSQTNQKSIERYIAIENENYPLLKNFSVIDKLIETKRFHNVLCLGAGPSLDAHIEDVIKLVKQPGRPLLIAPSSALNALLKHDIQPDIVAVIDIGIEAESIPFDKLKETIFVGSSRAQKAIWECWKGDKYYFHLIDETFDRINQKLPSKYRLNIFGSVIHPITHLAILLGAKTIRYVGCDFGFPGGIQHASTDDDYQIDMSVSVENGYGELIKSSPTFRMYCSGIENIIAQRPDIDFINMSRIGAKIIGTRYEDEGM